MGLKNFFGGERKTGLFVQEQAKATPEIKQGATFYLKSDLLRASGDRVGEPGDKITINQIHENDGFVGIDIGEPPISAIIEMTSNFFTALSLEPVQPSTAREIVNGKAPIAAQNASAKMTDVGVLGRPKINYEGGPLEVAPGKSFYLKKPLTRASSGTIGKPGAKIVIDQILEDGEYVSVRVGDQTIPAMVEMDADFFSALSIDPVEATEVMAPQALLRPETKESGDVTRGDLKVGATFTLTGPIPENMDTDLFWGQAGDEITIDMVNQEAVTYHFSKTDIPDFGWVHIRTPFHRPDFGTHFLGRLQKKKD